MLNEGRGNKIQLKKKKKKKKGLLRYISSLSKKKKKEEGGKISIDINYLLENIFLLQIVFRNFACKVSQRYRREQRIKAKYPPS